MDYDKLVDKFLARKLLFVTSFNKDIYDCTGNNLILSFINNCKDENIELLICYENFDFTSSNNNIICENVMSNFLKKILSDNKDVIPKCYGGIAENTIFKNRFNFQASRWFRKLAALEIAHNKYGNNYEYIIWIDSDCLFINNFNYDCFINPLKDNIIGYFYGPKRLQRNHGIETGLVLFHKSAYNILNLWYSLLNNKQFTKITRWDDGFLFKYLLYDSDIEKDKFLDFAENYFQLNPMEYGPYVNLVKHMKGIHQSNNIVQIN